MLIHLRILGDTKLKFMNNPSKNPEVFILNLVQNIIFRIPFTKKLLKLIEGISFYTGYSKKICK